MEYLIGIIVALVGGLFYFVNKSSEAVAENKISETKGRDRELAEQQAEIEQALKDLEDGIVKMNQKREKEKAVYRNRTLKERADEARNRYKK